MSALLAAVWLLSSGQQLPKGAVSMGIGLGGGARTPSTGLFELFIAPEYDWTPHLGARFEFHLGWDPLFHITDEVSGFGGVVARWRSEPGSVLVPYVGLGVGLGDFTFGFEPPPSCYASGFDEECVPTFAERSGFAPIAWAGFRLGNEHVAFDLSGTAEYFRINGFDQALVSVRLGLAFTGLE